MGEYTDKSRGEIKHTPDNVSGNGKKVYARAQLKRIKIELGVYGCYGRARLKPDQPVVPWRNEDGSGRLD